MLRRNMTSAECQISDPKGRYLVFTLLFFQMPMMKTQDLNTKIITKKPKSARNCESRAKGCKVIPKNMKLIVYSAFWCADCRVAKRFLEQNNVPFTEIDIENTPGAADEVV